VKRNLLSLKRKPCLLQSNAKDATTLLTSAGKPGSSYVCVCLMTVIWSWRLFGLVRECSEPEKPYLILIELKPLSYVNRINYLICHIKTLKLVKSSCI
jgi:hypothetical protein